MPEDLNKSALEYHRLPRPGKIEVVGTKPLANQRDLALAYSPGVAAPCAVIAADASRVADFTDRGNLVAVITNGTAVLGLGDIGPLAAKPVMEGKAVLFKNFAGIDVFDLEIAEKDPDKLVDIIASLEPTFGGINLEDIKAPECFMIEGKLRNRINIPVFHDDQHGTAIITAAAIVNALKLVDKKIEDVSLVTSGAGAAAIACLRLLEMMGMPTANVTITDRRGVVYRGRKDDMDSHKRHFARDTNARTLADAIVGADIFLGLSVGGLLKPEMVATMAPNPIILALANPTPEITPEDAKSVRDDVIIATGRSDYPNQVNNVLCFPYIFRGALDVGATTINDPMKIACVEALAGLAHEEASDVVVAAYGGTELSFGPEYIIPKPFDPRLIVTLAPAVAKAAMDSGVATRAIPDLEAYREQLTRFVFKSVLIMKPLLDKARTESKRIVYAEGEEPRVLRAVKTVIDEGLARPLLIGRPQVIATRIKRLRLRMSAGEDFDLINPESDRRFREFWQTYHDLVKRRGVTPEDAKTVVRTQNTAIAALALRLGAADAMLCGVTGRYEQHLKYILDIIGLEPGIRQPSAMTALVLKKGTYFVCDTHVNADPGAEELAEMTELAVRQMARFGVTPKVALLSHSNFGSSQSSASAGKMRAALELIIARLPDLEVDGEMSAQAALQPAVRADLMPDSRLTGEANLLIMPTLDAANIAMNLLSVLGDGVSVGPILLGPAKAAHILTPTASVRRITNMSAIAAVEAQMATRVVPA
ncbi:MAG: NADP-dependent malic enzyme [Gammaproteobacteria bacterium]|nr:NADP-dependent malic enzyme [Gammaproteobacteria bacterium]